MLSLLTTYAKQSQPDLETVLVKLKQLKGIQTFIPFNIDSPKLFKIK